jgi:hypothetical protein
MAMPQVIDVDDDSPVYSSKKTTPKKAKLVIRKQKPSSVKKKETIRFCNFVDSDSDDDDFDSENYSSRGKKRPPSPDVRETKVARLSQEDYDREKFENHENSIFYNDIFFNKQEEEEFKYDEEDDYEETAKLLNSKTYSSSSESEDEQPPALTIQSSKKSPIAAQTTKKEIKPIQVDDDAEIDTDVVPKRTPTKLWRPAVIVSPSQPIAVRTSPYFSPNKGRVDTTINTKEIDEGRVLINDTMVKYSQLAFRDDGSFQARLNETKSLFEGIRRDGTKRTILFDRKAMKDIWYMTEKRCFGFKLSSHDNYLYHPEDEDSCSNGYIIFITKTRSMEFANRMKILSRKDTFLKGVTDEERQLNADIDELRNLLEKNESGVWELECKPKIVAEEKKEEEEQGQEEYEDIGSQIADLRDNEKDEVQISEVNPTDLVLEHHNISITHADLDRLNEGEFLNDNLIDIYMQFLCDGLAPEVVNRYLHTLLVLALLPLFSLQQQFLVCIRVPIRHSRFFLTNFVIHQYLHSVASLRP